MAEGGIPKWLLDDYTEAEFIMARLLASNEADNEAVIAALPKAREITEALRADGWTIQERWPDD